MLKTNIHISNTQTTVQPIVSALAAAFLIAASVSATAATIVVDTLYDGVDHRYCSIRSALEAARSDRRSARCAAGEPGADTIRFARHLQGELDLLTPLEIGTGVNIEGYAWERVALTGDIVVVESGDERVGFSTLDFRTGLLVRSAAELHIEKVNFLGISSQMSRASAIQIQGPGIGVVRLSHTRFIDNQGGDGPIFVDGNAGLAELAIDNSRFQSNRGDLAGAIYIENQDPIAASIVATDFVENSAETGLSGGIVTDGPVDLTLDGSSFAFNRGGESGALSAMRISGLKIVNSVFERNNGRWAGAVWLWHFEVPNALPELLFSTIVNNGDQMFRPALVNESGLPLQMRANLLRGAYGNTCDYSNNRSLGYNIEIGGGSCALWAGNDWPYASMDLYRASLPGRYPVPVPDPAPYFSAVDAVPMWDCEGTRGLIVDTDLAGRSRPVEFAGGTPSYYCDVGAVELRAGDQLQPMP